jgi:hypothetical protein
MAKDHRLALDRYIDFTKDPFIKKRQVNFDDSFSSKPSSGKAPWMPSRFTEEDLLRRVQTRKLQLNPTLNFVGNVPEEYEVFANIGRFTRKEGYDFENGRPNTVLRPEDQPGFSPVWVEAYRISPTINPDKRATNPMPRVANPDPKGYMMATAEKRALNEAEDNKSVAQLLSKPTENNNEQTFKKNNETPEKNNKDPKDAQIKSPIMKEKGK